MSKVIDQKKAGVTVIGLGTMGTALAKAFLNKGYRTTVWNRSSEKAKNLVTQGAIYHSAVTDAIASSPIVIICVLDYQAVYDILGQVADGTLSDKVVINLTNGTPEQARQMQEKVAQLGADYLDGGIMAIPSLIARPEAVLLYSGSPSVFENYHHTLDILGSSKYLGTDPGLAALHDLALLSGMYGMFGGFLHSTALVRSESGKAEAFTSELLIPWLHAMITALPEMASMIDSGNYTTTGSSLQMQVVASDTISEVSMAQGISTELLTPLFSLMKQRVAEGHGRDDFPSIIELLHQSSKKK